MEVRATTHLSRLLLLALAWALAPRTAHAQQVSEIHLIREGWAAPVAPETIAAAIVVRLPGRRVAISDRAPDSGGCDVSLRANGAETAELRVSCDGADPLTDEVLLVPATEVPRRIAVQTVLLLSAAEAEAGRARGGPPTTPLRAVPAVRAEAALARPTAPSRTLHPAPGGVEPSTVAFRVGGGAAIAADLPGATYGVIIDARWFMWRRLHALGGAKLAGEFREQAGSEVHTVADRTFWLGVGYRLELAHIFIDASLAAAYTVPVLESEGPTEEQGEGEPSELDRASRWALRPGISLGWMFRVPLALVIDFAANTSFVKREAELNGREVLELGALVLDVTAAIEVSF